MIVQSTPIILKQRNQPNRECLYAWYPEVSTEISMPPRDIYIHKGLDKDLLQENLSTNKFIDHSNNNNSNNEILQRYKQSIAPSERIYHSTETMDGALQTPWALHYEIQRRPATPNPPSHSTEFSKHNNVSRRLQSAPLVRSIPSPTVLTIPEPKFINPILPMPQTPTLNRPKTRASSAKARLNTTFPNSNETKSKRREIKSAYGIRSKDENKLSDENYEKASTIIYSDTNQQEPLSVPSSPSVYAYQKSGTWINDETSSITSDNKTLGTPVEMSSIFLNPFHVHRPAIISVSNSEKKPIVQETNASKKHHKHSRRHHRRHHQQNQPLLALTPISTTTTTKSPVEIDGIKLFYDPSITLDDPSLNLTKYFIEGRLYLIKDQCYNVIENVDPSIIEKYNQNFNLPQRPKYYQTIPIEKFQIPKPAMDIHYNASETFFYNTIPKRVTRYVIDPNFISENLNVNKISLSKRPSTINEINRQQGAATVYA